MKKQAALSILVLLVLLLCSLSGRASAQAPTPTVLVSRLSVTPLSGWGNKPVIWSPDPFCVQSWWGPLLCSEVKGPGDHPVGFAYKLDFYPAWLALIGKDARGWQLAAVAFERPVTPPATPMPPGGNFVLVSGPVLVEVIGETSATPTPSPSPTATPTGTPSTPTPSPVPSPTHPITPVTPTPMFPEFPTCTTQILVYWAGDPATGGLGGKVGSVTWCGSCNSGCGVWMLGVDKATLDGWTADANARVHQLWTTMTPSP